MSLPRNGLVVGAGFLNLSYCIQNAIGLYNQQIPAHLPPMALP